MHSAILQVMEYIENNNSALYYDNWALGENMLLTLLVRLPLPSRQRIVTVGTNNLLDFGH